MHPWIWIRTNILWVLSFHQVLFLLSPNFCRTFQVIILTNKQQQMNLHDRGDKCSSTVLENKQNSRYQRPKVTHRCHILFYVGPWSDPGFLCLFLFIQVINGLMEREDWQEAIQTPLGVLPGGSGNAMAASIHHYSQ